MFSFKLKSRVVKFLAYLLAAGSLTFFTASGMPAAYADQTFSQTFTTGATPSTTITTAWDNFAASLTGTYTTLTISGTYGSISVTHSTYVTAIASYLRTYVNGTASTSWLIGSNYVSVGKCAVSDGVELSISAAGSGVCSCQTTGWYTIRPKIGNNNWGGLNGNTCNAATQTITVTFGGGMNTVTFDSNGGTGSPSVSSVTQASAGSTVTLATQNTLARTGFTYSGWNTAADGTGTTYSDSTVYTPASSLTMYAQWNSTITYNGNTPTTGSVPTSTTAKSSAAVTTLATNTGNLAKTGFTFGGWNTNTSGTGTSYAAGLTTYASAGSTTLYAQWNSNITYLANGATSGSVPAASSLYGTSGTLAGNTGTLAKTNFTPTGWNTNETGTGTSYGFSGAYTPTGNKSLYAEWSSVVTYNGNSNTTGTAPGATTIKGISGTLASNTGSLTQTGKVFAGWNTNSTGTGTWYAAGATYPNSGNITLYAQWVTALSLTGPSTLSVGQGIAFRSDTYTATSGLDTKTVTYALWPNNAGITLETTTVTGTTYAFIRVGTGVIAGTYTDTLTAQDRMGTTLNLVVTITVSSPLGWASTNASSVVTTTGTASSVRLDVTNGFSGKAFTLTHMSTPSNSGITLDTSTASSGYTTLNISNAVPAGTYVESITATDSSGRKIVTTVTVTVNGKITVTKDGVSVGAGYTSLLYNGSNQFSYLPASTKYQVGSTWTMEWWQNQTDSSLYTRIFSMGGNYFGVSLEGTMLYLWTGSTYSYSASIGTSRRSVWTHFAIVSNAGVVSAYQNGTLLTASYNATTSTPLNINSTAAPSTYALCFATQCTANVTPTVGSGNTWFGGNLANFTLSTRADYSASFTPATTMKVDANTVFALQAVNSAATLTDLSTNNLTFTNVGSPTGSPMAPTGAAVTPEIATTQGVGITSSAFIAANGTGNKTFTMTSNNSGLSYSASTNQATVSIANTVTATNSTTAKTLYETLTATDSVTSSLPVPVKFTINPPVALAATSTTPSTAAGVAIYDTITATYGTGTKTFSVVSSSTPSGITFSKPSANIYLITADKTVQPGTYIETVTATDSVSATSVLVITLTVNPGLSLTSATGSTSVSTTAGKATSIRLNAANGSGTRTFTMVQAGTSQAAITLDNSTASSGYVTINYSSALPAGTYSETVTVTDTSGGSANIVISVTVAQALTLSYNGATSGAIALTTTAGSSVTTTAFTAALGTGTRTLTLSGLNSAISIDTSTANVGYVTLGSGLTSTSSTVARTVYETVTATDATGFSISRALTITVNPAITLAATATTLTTTSGVAITDTITATYGTGNKSFSISAPSDISSISKTTNIANQTTFTVPGNVAPGTYTITITATDSVLATTSISVTLIVNAAVSVSGSNSISMTTGYAFNTNAYSTSGGSGTYTFALTGTLNSTYISLETITSTSFRLKVTSSAPSGSGLAAIYYETVTVTDSLGAKGYAYVTLTVNDIITLLGAQTINATFGVSSTNVYRISGGTPSYYILGNSYCAPVQTFDGSYTVLSFVATGNCSFQIPANVSSVDYLLVGAGGGGAAGGYNSLSSKGGGGGGGGGGGQVLTQTLSGVAGSLMSVAVGAGGAGGSTGGRSTGSWAGTHGRNGNNSSIVVNGTTTTATGGSAGLGGGFWAPTTPSSTACNTRNFTFDGISVYYIDGVGGKGGNSGSGLSGQKPYCDTTTSTGLGGRGGGGAGSSTSGTAPTAIGTDLQAGGSGTSSSISGTSTEYGTGGFGGGGEGGGSNPPAVGAAGSRAGMGGTGGAGSIRADSTSIGATGGAGANGLLVLRYLTPSTDDNTRLNIYTDAYLTSPGKIVVGVPDSITVGTYVETFTVTDSAATPATNTYVVTINVAKATPSVSLSIPGGGSTATYGSPVSLIAASSTPGTFTFKKGGTDISGCTTRATTSGSATCSWTPTDTSTVSISAFFTPTDTTDYNTTTTSNLTLTVPQADTLTVTFNSQTFTYSDSGTTVSRAYTLSGLASIDSITAVATSITGTANDSTAVNITDASKVTKAGTFSLSGTGVTFNGSNKSSYYKAIVYSPGTITVNRAGNTLSFNYGTNNTITYKPTGVETVTAVYKGTSLPFYSTVTTNNCSVNSSSGSITTTRAGSCDISMAVAESPNFLGDTITATVTINKASRTVTLSSTAASLKYAETATVATTISFDVNDGVISYSNGSSTGCSFDSVAGIVTATSGTATCTLTGAIAEGTNYAAATSSTLTISLSKANAPVVTLIAPANVNYSPTATSASMPLPTYSITGLKFDDTATALSNLTVTYINGGAYSYNSATVPVNANIYTLVPSALTLAVGSISNYNTPTYNAVQWTINQIAQESLTVKSALNEDVTVPLLIAYSGGSTNGSVSGQIISGGTASSCTFSVLTLQANSTGTCFIRIKMLGNQNYLDVWSDTYTVTIAKWTQTVFNFDSLGGGSTGISISSQVPFTVGEVSCSTACQPTITSVSPTSFEATDLIIITGTDFAGASQVIFNRSVIVTDFTVTGNDTIAVKVPTGLTPGPGSISVVNAGKISFRFSGLTIKPPTVVG